jgi:hypothetical protein
MSENKKLLGDGADLTGRQVEYWNDIWTIIGKNYFGDWNVEKQEFIDSKTIKIQSSIDPFILPKDHPHYARLLSTN